MRIGIQTWGSDGDIRPFIALGAGLKAAGHEVSLAVTNVEDKYYDSIASQLQLDITYVATPVIKDKERLNAIGLACLNKKNPIKQTEIVLNELFLPAVDEMYSAAQKLCQKSDLVINHFLLYPLAVAAEKYQIPRVSVILTHNIIPSQNLCPIGFPNLGKWLYPFWWWIAKKMLNRMILHPINQLRKKEGLSAAHDVMTEALASKELNLIAVSPVLCQRQGDWGEHYQPSGFLSLPDTSSGWDMGEAMKKFLSYGKPPVYMTFGSLMPKTSETIIETIDLFWKAISRADCRAIIQVTEEDVIEKLPIDKNIFYTSSVLHKHIFPHCAAVVHHGGAGTTQTTLLAGVPSVVVAHVLDQFFWGNELHRLGVAPKAISRSSLSAELLAKNIRDVLDTPSIRESVQKISALMKEEDGVSKAVKIIEKRFIEPES